MTEVAIDETSEERDLAQIERLVGVETMLTPRSSITDVSGRRLSRASINWFQREIEERGLIGGDGKLRDDYIVKRQSVNRPAALKSIPLLCDLTADVHHVDGWVLSQLLLSGYAKMATKIDELNKINVFPIADGDTGANMKVCLKLPTRNLLLDPSDNILTVASNMAADVLLNGQGNSGTILSHFFVSLAEEIKATGKEQLSMEEFTTCLNNAGVKMKDAVPNPVEGTLLSVSRDACRLLQGPFASLSELLEAWNTIAQAELAKTPDQLVVDGVKILEKAGVVDSGAQGFVYVIEGMYLASKGELEIDANLFQSAKVVASEEITVIDVDHTVTDSKYQYCTEAVVVLKDGVSPSDVVKSITSPTPCGCEIGDSIASVSAPAKEGGQMCKVHIHTNDPEAVFNKVRSFSRYPILKKEKVEDMLAMRDHTHGDDSICDDLSDAKFTIVGMCAMLLPPSMQSDELMTLPIFMVPATTQEPLDIRYCTDSETTLALNMQRHESTRTRYTTAASNPMQIKIELLAALSKGKPVLVFIMSRDKRVSALGQNVLRAVEMLTPEQQTKVKIMEHGWGFFEQLFTVEAIRMAQAGKTLEETYAACEDMAARSFIFASFAASLTVKKLVAWRPGLFPEGFTVEDGQYVAFGLPPVLREGEPLTTVERVGKLMTVQTKAPSLEDLQDLEVLRIKNALKPGQSMSSVLVSCVGRPDYGHAFVRKLRKADICISGEPIVFNMGFLSVATSSWGEMAVFYNIKQSE